MRWRETIMFASLPFLAAAALTTGEVSGQDASGGETGVKVLVFGVDGAAWEVIDPMLRRGELPAFRKLIEGGVRAPLKSIEPLLSPAIWTTIATGKLPAEHGIEDFHSTRLDLKAKRIWDVISESGQPVGIFGWLSTWPPDRVNGFIVPGWLAHGPEAWPGELSFISAWGRNNAGLDLEKASRFGLSPEHRRAYLAFDRVHPFLDPDSAESMFLYRMTELPIKTDLFLHLYQTYRPRLAAYVNTGVDNLSHFLWKYYQPEAFADVPREEIERFGDCIPAFYREVDRMLARLLAARDRNTVIFVLSDHGFQAEPGLVHREIDMEALLKRLGWDDIRYTSLGASAFLDLSSSRRSAAEITEVLRAARREGKDGPFFEVPSPEGTGDLLVRICRALETGGKTADAEWIVIGGERIPFAEIVRLNPLWSGNHALYGIFIANGPPFRENAEISKASVVDIAPTIMATLGYPVAEDLKGKVLTETFRPEFLARHPVKTIETYGPPAAPESKPPGKNELPDDLKQKLKSLGYL